ncbi:MAG: CPBP family glutamic-type intramembrane protease [Candidatus Bathyarchaeia archaeon]
MNNIARVGLAICNMFFIGFSEEFIFRGPLLRTLIRGLNTHLGFPWWAAAIIGLTVSASFFALYHFQRYGTAYNNFYPFVVLMALGYVWGVLSFFFGTLSAGLGHSFWDILAMAAVGGW